MNVEKEILTNLIRQGKVDRKSATKALKIFTLAQKKGVKATIYDILEKYDLYIKDDVDEEPVDDETVSMAPQDVLALVAPYRHVVAPQKQVSLSAPGYIAIVAVAVTVAITMFVLISPNDDVVQVAPPSDPTQQNQTHTVADDVSKLSLEELYRKALTESEADKKTLKDKYQQLIDPSIRQTKWAQMFRMHVLKEEPYVPEGFTGVLEEFDVDGKLHAKVPYKNGLKHGFARSYHSGDLIKRETEYFEGKQDGLDLLFDEECHLRQAIFYKKGSVISWRYYFNKKGGIEKLQKLVKNADGQNVWQDQKVLNYWVSRAGSNPEWEKEFVKSNNSMWWFFFNHINKRTSNMKIKFDSLIRMSRDDVGRLSYGYNITMHGEGMSVYQLQKLLVLKWPGKSHMQQLSIDQDMDPKIYMPHFNKFNLLHKVHYHARINKDLVVALNNKDMNPIMEFDFYKYAKPKAPLEFSNELRQLRYMKSLSFSGYAVSKQNFQDLAHSKVYYIALKRCHFNAEDLKVFNRDIETKKRRLILTLTRKGMDPQLIKDVEAMMGELSFRVTIK